MKRLFQIAMLLAMILMLCACGDTQQQAQQAQLADLGEYDLYAGFGRENITPLEPTPLGGYSNASNRIHQAVLDDLYVTAIALTDAQGETILLMNWDGVRSYTEVQEELRARLAKAGLPVIGIDELKEKTEAITGKPRQLPKGDRVVAEVIYRDGTLLDRIYQVPEGSL